MDRQFWEEWNKLKEYIEDLKTREALLATEEIPGVLEVATQAESDAGALDDKIITPLKLVTTGDSLYSQLGHNHDHGALTGLADDDHTQYHNDARGDARYTQKANNLSDVSSAATAFGNIKQVASDTTTGVVELATNAETQTGTDTVRAITPANLSARTATETRTGIAELATQSEFDAGTDTNRIVTPAKVRAGYLKSNVFGYTQKSLSLSNGLNSDINAGGSAGSFYRVTGPTGAFSIGGFNPSGGSVAGGDILIIYNSTAQNMTIVNLDGSSTVGFRIQTLTGANITLTGSSSVTMIYVATDGRWTVIATSG